ncbi:MAG: nucleotide exchange factor GrpE [Porticoccus sp.]|nr:nucleotide exchange factor GrpE [Porticoccus sp.]MBQ0807828.1 nucleotide exchange factor GrpE [Porticoccus sp.]MDX2350572.1 nucleotide exchange factor GrpE [Porticoccus sp.]
MSTEENNSQETGAEELQPEVLETEQSPLEGETPEVEGDLVQLQTELDVAKDQELRTQAEMQNLRRRAERDVENAHKYALDKFVGELLPVVDNLERAIQAMDDNNDDIKVLSEGIELTLKSFQDVLARFKVEAVDPKGEVFNPEFHQAVSMLEMPDQAPNTVVDVFQKGYTLNGRLVRPAMVVVVKAAPNNTGEG